MASEILGQTVGTGPEPVPEKKSMPRRRRKRLVIATVVIAVALIVVFWGWSSTGAKNYLQVGTLVDGSSDGVIPNQYLNRTIEVQGVIVGWDGSASDLSFSLADKTHADKTIDVSLIGTLPAEFSNGKTAVVKGELNSTLPLRLAAAEITLGCASRY